MTTDPTSQHAPDERVWATVTVRDAAGETRKVAVPRGSAFDRPLPSRTAAPDERVALREEILEAIAANESMPIGAEGAMRRAERTLDLYVLAARPAVDVEGIARVLRDHFCEYSARYVTCRCGWSARFASIGATEPAALAHQARTLAAAVVAYLAGEGR